MSHVFYRLANKHYPTVAKGDGCYLIDTEGKRYLDACGGAAVSCLGHSNEVVKEAIAKQMEAVPFAHTGFFTNQPMEALADWLAERAPGDINKVYFFSGGSEAVEGAIKLARQYFVEQGKSSKHKVIARWQSYHGNTLGALSAGGNKWRRRQFDPLLIEMSHIPPCNAYRGKEEGETDHEYGQRVANSLEEEIQRLGADQVAAFIAEPVVGATMGAVPAVEGYLKRIAEICKQYDVLLILDEVMCGMGRTGTLFACEQDGVEPDIITMAKGLGAGYQPIAAMLVNQPIFDAISKGSGFFQHGHTYIGHAMACAASLAVGQEIEAHSLLANVRKQGDYLQQQLQAQFADHPHVGDIRGRGLFIGVEIVEDRESKAPFDPAKKIHSHIKESAMQAGLMCYPMGGTVDGKQGDHVLFAPPYIIETSHCDEIIEKFSIAMKAASA